MKKPMLTFNVYRFEFYIGQKARKSAELKIQSQTRADSLDKK